MKNFLTFILLIISVSVFGQSNPFQSLKFDSVIVYDYDGSIGEGGTNIIDGKGQLAKTVIRKATLTKTQTASIIKLLGDSSTYGGNHAMCFTPRMGLVFYKDKKVLAHVSICFECNLLSSSIHIPATEVKKIKISDNYEYAAEGFSKTARQKLNLFCKQLGFSNCIDKLNTDFDK